LVDTRTIDGRTATFRHEPGRSPSLVCVHGAADNHHAYDRLLDALPGRDRYAINLPARAGTDGPAATTVAEMTDFLDAFAEAEVEGDYVVAGHSLGGAVATEHALRSPERLKGLVLLATGARLRVHPLIFQLFDQAAKNGAPPPVPPGLYEPGTDPALIEEASRRRGLTPVETGCADWRAADDFDRMRDLDRIGVPALIVAGTEDMLTPPKYAEYMATHFTEAELQLIDGAGHMLVMDRVEQIAPWIESFVDHRDTDGSSHLA
jgi:pimeloyl-ACP methyl ester carboxylesterase